MNKKSWKDDFIAQLNVLSVVVIVAQGCGDPVVQGGDPPRVSDLAGLQHSRTGYRHPCSTLKSADIGSGISRSQFISSMRKRTQIHCSYCFYEGVFGGEGRWKEALGCGEKMSFAFYRFYFGGDLKVFRKRSSGKLKFSRIFSLFFLITALHGRQKMRLKRDCKISINTFEK